MDGGGGRTGQRKMFGQPPNCRKVLDRDEDLVLFREMHRKEKDCIVSLLQPVSDEFEANGNYPLYRMASAKKGLGHEYLGDTGKNDYDWLKTPPATPLFPSLEMEATNASELVVQREIPIIHSLSRFSTGNLVVMTKETRKERSKSPNPKQKAPPLRCVTPSQRPSVSKASSAKSKPMLTEQKMNQLLSSSTYLISRRATAAKPILNQQLQQKVDQSPDQNNFLVSNLSKRMGALEYSKTKPTSRGVSPAVRLTIPAQIEGLSDQTPPNLKTDRSSSASRSRYGSQTTLAVAASNIAKQTPESNPKKTIRRQSCSPSVTRGRKVDTITKQAESIRTGVNNTTETDTHETTRKVSSRTQLAGRSEGNGTQILGSRMVDKFMSARKLSAAEDRETNSKLPLRESSGVGRIMSKSSLDMALKHLDVKRGASGDFHRGSSTTTTSGRKYSTIESTTPTS
ncbi:hypothetical protein Acr_22g0006880 [Actinidia rufa]|uniref:Uncharacterized protein n=1 Tax=Actinidia rufa TaxID=165716 RepID=A0A7J0GKH4_9ERIC|nr:hypothetical protein Acr_22g0006880 [Actinidia rufa]